MPEKKNNSNEKKIVKKVRPTLAAIKEKEEEIERLKEALKNKEVEVKEDMYKKIEAIKKKESIVKKVEEENLKKKEELAKAEREIETQQTIIKNKEIELLQKEEECEKRFKEARKKETEFKAKLDSLSREQKQHENKINSFKQRENEIANKERELKRREEDLKQREQNKSEKVEKLPTNEEYEALKSRERALEEKERLLLEKEKRLNSGKNVAHQHKEIETSVADKVLEEVNNEAIEQKEGKPKKKVVVTDPRTGKTIDIEELKQKALMIEDFLIPNTPADKNNLMPPNQAFEKIEKEERLNLSAKKSLKSMYVVLFQKTEQLFAMAKQKTIIEKKGNLISKQLKASAHQIDAIIELEEILNLV